MPIDTGSLWSLRSAFPCTDQFWSKPGETIVYVAIILKVGNFCEITPIDSGCKTLAIILEVPNEQRPCRKISQLPHKLFTRVER